MICHEHACVFVHIPKTAGTSFEIALTGFDWVTTGPDDHAIYRAERDRYSPTWGGTLAERDPDYFRRGLARKHASQGALRAELGAERWRRYFRFTFVRNPWERMLSLYDHTRRDAGGPVPPFRDWLTAPDPRDHMGQPVWRHPIDDWDDLDFVGRYERLREGWAQVCAALGTSVLPLPHESHGSDGRHDWSRYDDESRALVAKHFAAEIERFGYAFGDSGT